jgi:phospholipid/cholesterol/gamma-HCH transport system substrate-binding protein
MSERGRHVLVLILFTTATVAIFAFLLRSTGTELPGGNRGYRVSVVVPSALQLAVNADVRAAGVKVGKVANLSFRRAGGATLDLRLDDTIAPLARDAVVSVRTKTLLGENYVSIEPGTRRQGTIPDGGSLAPRQVEDPAQLDQLLSVFDAKTRRAVSRDLRSMGDGFARRGKDLNAALGALAPATDATGSVAAVLAHQREDVHGVVRHVGRLLETLGNRQNDIAFLVRRGRRAADLLSARERQIRQPVTELPGLLAQTQRTAARLGRFADSSTPVVDELGTAAIALRPTVAELHPTALAARRLFDRVPALVRALDPLLLRLRSLSRAAPGTVRELDTILGRLNPALRFLSPYAKEVGSFMANFGSINNDWDALGAVARVYPQFGPSSSGLITPALRPLFDRLLDVTGIGKINKVQTDHYPRPGTIGKPGSSNSVPALPSGR